MATKQMTVTAEEIQAWKTGKQDTHSASATQTLTTSNDFQFEYNNTSTSKNVTLTQGMIDITGTKYLGTISIPAYSSLILIKDYNPALVLKYVITGSSRISSNGNILSITN
jgi:hypothetical protein